MGPRIPSRYPRIRHIKGKNLNNEWFGLPNYIDKSMVFEIPIFEIPKFNCIIFEMACTEITCSFSVSCRAINNFEVKTEELNLSIWRGCFRIISNSLICLLWNSVVNSDHWNCDISPPVSHYCKPWFRILYRSWSRILPKKSSTVSW